ncbi:SusE domain-containing protein [Pontibacter chitinilyticus]|uniref:SusE domain-containing protein n=1 Tax=Pontibacter chitinilyticus TaxID=2674989 RepID=UPI00321A993B
MKRWFNYTFIFSMLTLALFSCEKDEEQAILRAGTAPVLAVSTTNVVLTEENAANEAVTFTWDKADFGYMAAVNYSLQIDTAGNNFAQPYSIALGNEPKKTFTVEELNNLLTKLKYTPDEAHDLPMRIKASVSDKVSPVYSNVITLSVTPYSTYVEPTYVYVPGGYQDWKPETAPALASVENNEIYQGLISFVDASSLEFKITKDRSWNDNYGSGDAAGSLAPNGANLSVPTADTYMLVADFNTLTWTAAKYSWGVIGDATPGGWDADTNMKYINDEGVWKITLPLKAGAFKFRFNDAWDTNYGDDDTSNPALNASGANIAVATAGTYEITLDVDNEDGSVTYAIVKK